jgi:hypothetical protein
LVQTIEIAHSVTTNPTNTERRNKWVTLGGQELKYDMIQQMEDASKKTPRHNYFHLTVFGKLPVLPNN